MKGKNKDRSRVRGVVTDLEEFANPDQSMVEEIARRPLRTPGQWTLGNRAHCARGALPSDVPRRYSFFSPGLEVVAYFERIEEVQHPEFGLHKRLCAWVDDCFRYFTGEQLIQRAERENMQHGQRFLIRYLGVAPTAMNGYPMKRFQLFVEQKNDEPTRTE